MPIPISDFKATVDSKAKPPTEKPKLSEYILVDTREKSQLYETFKALGYPTAEGPLPVGDIKYKDIIVERKTIGDFVGSMISGRLDSQFLELAYVPLPFVAIIGNIEEWEATMEEKKILVSFNKEAIYGMMASTVVRYGIGVWMFPTDYELAKVFGKVCEKVDAGKIGVPHRLRVAFEGRDKRIDLIAVMLGITRTQAKNLLHRFQNPLQLFTMSAGDLQRTPGVGEITAKKIRAFCDTPFKE